MLGRASIPTSLATCPNRRPFARINGFAGGIQNIACYAEQRAVFRVDLSTSQTRPMIESDPLQAPSDLALVGDALFIADARAGAVFRMNQEGGPAERLPIETLGAGRRILLAGGDHSLLIATPDNGQIVEVEGGMRREVNHRYQGSPAGNQSAR